ncbi:Ig-like domain-containing protein [Fibrobacter sp.]|uniref:Ig-like domain-containing protein n=1 Tax=Fibrobacter sp. TaxID=35828 RepID=UPI0038906015
MGKKIALWMGALLGAMTSSVFAASATVWTEDGPGDKEPAYWYAFDYGTGASVDTSTTADNVKVAEFVAKPGKTDNGAGFGFTWEQNSSYKDVPISLASYKGACLTYRSTAPFRIDFRQSTITDDNYYGSELAAGSKKLFIAFANLKQGWKSTTTVAWNVSKQLGVQFSYKNTHATSSVNTNTVEIISFILADECVTNPPVLQPPYQNGDEVVLNEGEALSYDLTKMFVDPDGEDLTYTVAITGDVVLADSLYKTGTLNLKTTENPSGSATVKVTATDASKKSATYQFTVETVDGENAPVAADDSFETKEETRLAVTATSSNNILKNDYDADGDKFVAELVDSTAHGALTFTPSTGAFIYIPEKDFFGTDSFTYRVVETARSGDASYEVRTSNVATVTINVKNVDDSATVTVVKSAFTVDTDEYALGDTVEVNEDFEIFTVNISAEDVVFADPDALAGDVPLAVKASGVVTAAYVHVQAGDSYVIDISSIENANGVAKVTLYVQGEESVNVFFYVKVKPVSDPPIAVDDSYTVVQDSVNKILKAKGVLANDKDPDNAKSSLKAYLYDGAIEGTVTLAEDGSFTYEIGHYEGEDSFMYYVVNAEGDTSQPALVTLTVERKNLPPQVVDGVADTVGNRLAALKEDFPTPKQFSKKELQSWFTDDTDAPTDLVFAARSDDSLLNPSISSTGVLMVRSVADACGDAEVILIVKDKKGATTEFAIPAHIACEQDKPKYVNNVRLDTVYVGVGPWSGVIDFNDYVYDPDGDSLTFTVTPTNNFNEWFDWSQDGNLLTASNKEDKVLAPGKLVSFEVKAADAATFVTFKVYLIAADDPRTSIAPVIAAPKANWQNAIMASQGTVAIFDMQGRVMWSHRLPVSEAQVRNAAAQVQGRKILQVNRQSWTIK